MKRAIDTQFHKVLQKSASLALQALTVIAWGNANSLCRGLLYEPKVPTKFTVNKGGKTHEKN